MSQYLSVSVTADGKSFVTTQQRPAATIYVGDSPPVLSDKIDWKLTPVSTEQATGYGISWTAAGRLLQRDAAFHIYATGADGGNRVRLLENDDVNLDTTACGSGDTVVISRVTGEQHTQPVASECRDGRVEAAHFWEGRGEEFLYAGWQMGSVQRTPTG